MPYSAEDLAKLNLKVQDLSNLSEDAQRRKIRKQWSELCLRYHPDKNPGYRRQFDEVMDAYNKLTAMPERQESKQYYQPESVTIPDTAFDAVQQEAILTIYEDLLFEFSSLSTEKAREDFIAHYKPFLNLARSLKNKASELNEKRVELWVQQELNPRFLNTWYREWRMMLLRLYGEEFLDNFQYREAIATGNLRPVLSFIKLLSPIKFGVALINTIILFFHTAANHILKKITMNTWFDFIQLYNNRSARSLYAFLRVGFKFIALIMLLNALLYINPIWYVYALISPLIYKGLEFLACPVNQGVRPLAVYFDCSPILLSACVATVMVGLGVALLIMMQNMALGSVLISVLPWLGIGLNTYAIYLFIDVMRKMYEFSPTVFVFQMILLVCMLSVQYFIPPPLIAPGAVGSIAVESVFSGFLVPLSLVSIFRIARYQLENPSTVQGEMTEILPFPAEAIAPKIVDACHLGHKTAFWSHRLFHTPKNAEYLHPEDRTTKQQWASFFGGGEKLSSGRAIFVDASEHSDALRILDAPTS